MKMNRNNMIGADLSRISFSTGTDAVQPTNRLAFATRARWMIVDDDTDLLSLLSQMLELVVDVDVVSFSNSTEALLAFQADPAAYDIIITDYHMPGMNGMELCRRLRMVSPNLGVILSTSDETVSVEEALGRGFRTLLRKPYAIAALTELLARHSAQSNQTVGCDRSQSVWSSPASRDMQPAGAPKEECSHWIASF